MSFLSSPARNDENPRFRSASPSFSNSSPLQLTPRSKVRALLADLDDESDKDSPSNDTRRSPIRPLTDISHNAHPGPQREVSETQEEDQPVKPRGSLASRLFKSSRTDGIDSISKDDGEVQENAYDRIKKQLMGSKEKDAYTVPDPAQPGVVTDEDEEIFPAQSDRRERRANAALESEDEALEQSPKVAKGSSSGLFVSPTPSPPRQDSRIRSGDPPLDVEDSDEEFPEELGKNARFLALVERKRQERLEKEALEARQKKEKEEKMMKAAAAVLDIDTENQDSEDLENRLTQQARPTRKASKKAHEEIQRETQRMTRNMQLTHEARTRKKVTKQSLFARFNYKPASAIEGEKDENAALAEKTGSSVRGSDAEALHSTPPTSPPSFNNSPEKENDTAVVGQTVEEKGLAERNDLDVELPPIDDSVRKKQTLPGPAHKTQPGAATNIVVLEARSEDPGPSAIENKKQRKRLLPSRRAFSKRRLQVDSDSEIEILPKGKRLSIWDRKPEQKPAHSASLQALRALANLTSPSKLKSQGKAMTSGELQTSLQQRARQQAKKERDERLQQLRDRGIIIQTAEERAEEEAEIDNLLARAREADSKLSKKEKAAAKKNNDGSSHANVEDDSDGEKEWSEGNNQVVSELSDDESESNEDGDDEDDENAESEDSEVENEDAPGNQSSESQKSAKVSAMLDIQASEDDGDSEDIQNENSEDERFTDDEGEHVDDSGANNQITATKKRKPRRALVLSDDDDDEEQDVPDSSHAKATTTPVSAKKTVIPGLPTSDKVPLGLTQIFAGTMDESQTQEEFSQPISGVLDQEQDSLAFLRQLPQASLPEFDSNVASNVAKESQACVPDSQVRHNVSQHHTESFKPDIELHYSQSQAGPQYVRDSFVLESPSQYSDFPDPTQDVGFQKSSPIFDRFAGPPTSTMETVLLPAQETPAPKKKSRLVRRAVIPDLSDDESAPPERVTDDHDGEFHVSSDIFDVMRKAAKEKAQAPVEFSKKKSDAKGMVEEQAEESEDEYAGLGGASDDESGTEDAEFARDMLDDNAPDADERQLAAFYADKERAQDEKQVEKLYRDISNGVLRRKRGADYDLSDSDDEGEARRRRKQREFARMRKALLEDEEIGKIATNPKKEAFLRSIEDRAMDDDVNFLEDEDAPFSIGGGYSENVPQSQEGTDSQDKAIPPSSMSSKRKHPEKHEEARLPPHLRRTKGSRPSTLAEIRASLSFLIEEPNANESVDAELESSDIEVEQDPPPADGTNASQVSVSDDSTFAKPHPRRSDQKSQVVDRLSLLRKSSSSSLSTANNSGPVAFATSSDAPVFRVPSLLRRATTSSSTSSLASSSTGETERSAGGSSDKPSIVKRGSGKGSSVNFLMRESHKKGAVEGVEKRRMEVVKKKRAERKGALSILSGSWG